MTKQAYHHGHLREALIEAADAIISERGLEGFSLREAARRAAVSPAAPSHHFGGIKGLLTEVALLGYLALADHMGTMPENETARQTLRRMALAYVRFALAHPGRFRLMFRSDIIDRDDPRYQSASSAALSGLARAAREDGPVPSNAAIFAAWATIHGLAHLTLENKAQYLFDGDDAHTIMDRHLPAVVAMLWPDDPTPPSDPLSQPCGDRM